MKFPRFTPDLPQRRVGVFYGTVPGHSDIAWFVLLTRPGEAPDGTCAFDVLAECSSRAEALEKAQTCTEELQAKAFREFVGEFDFEGIQPIQVDCEPDRVIPWGCPVTKTRE